MPRAYARRLTGINPHDGEADPIAEDLLPDVIVTCAYGMDTDSLAVDLVRLSLS